MCVIHLGPHLHNHQSPVRTRIDFHANFLKRGSHVRDGSLSPSLCTSFLSFSWLDVNFFLRGGKWWNNYAAQTEGATTLHLHRLLGVHAGPPSSQFFYTDHKKGKERKVGMKWWKIYLIEEGLLFIVFGILWFLKKYFFLCITFLSKDWSLRCNE